jgi:hypothetical protein
MNKMCTWKLFLRSLNISLRFLKYKDGIPQQDVAGPRTNGFQPNLTLKVAARLPRTGTLSDIVKYSPKI